MNRGIEKNRQTDRYRQRGETDRQTDREREEII